MNKKKILFVDDDERFLKSMSYMLKKENYEVITAINAEDALNIFKSDKEIKVLLVDLKMPNISGSDFLKEVKDLGRPIRSILLTAHHKELTDKEAQELKIFSYLTKPIGSHAILFTLQSAFSDLELHEAKRWKDLAFITTETVHLIGNKISPIRRRIDEISKIIIDLYSKRKIDKSNYNKIIRDIEIIKDGAEQAHSIKSDLIDGSVHKRPINIINVLNEVITESKAEYKNIDIIYNANQKSQIIVAEEKVIKRIFYYLIKNAFQAIEDKNTLQVNYEKQISGIITIKTYIDDNHFIIDFEDNGCGIEEQDMEIIFKPFFTTKGADRGSGVGLYYCKRMMDDLEGDIKIKKTKVGFGTTISLKFPIPTNNQ